MARSRSRGKSEIADALEADKREFIVNLFKMNYFYNDLQQVNS